MKKILIILLAFGLFSHALCAEQTTPAAKQKTAATTTDKTKQVVAIVTALAKHLSINSGLCIAANPALSAATTASFALPIMLFLGWLLFLATANGVFLGDEIVHKVRVLNRKDKKPQEGDGLFEPTDENSTQKKFILYDDDHKQAKDSLIGIFYIFFVPGLMSILSITSNPGLKLSLITLLCHLVQVILAFLVVPVLTTILLAFLAPAGIAIDTLLAFTAYKNIPAIKNKNLVIALIHGFKNIAAKIKAAKTAKAHATA